MLTRIGMGMDKIQIQQIVKTEIDRLAKRKSIEEKIPIMHTYKQQNLSGH